MNLHQHRSVFNYFVCIMIVILLLAPSGVSLAQSSSPQPPVPATPFEGETILGDGLKGIQPKSSFMSTMSIPLVGTTYQMGADRLTALQNTDGGWGWELTGASAPNTIGPIGKGLAEAYLHTGDALHLATLTDAGALLLTKSGNFSPSDGYLAAALDDVFGVTTYTDYVKANFYDLLAAGTYTRAGFPATFYDTAAYVDRIRTNRSGTQANLAAWDIGMGLVGAASAGANTTAWIAGVKAEIDELNGAGIYDVIGLAGAVYGLAYVGADFDPTAGQHAAATNLDDLGAILASYQIPNSGGFAWNSAWVIPNDSDESVQETAYAILALNQLDRATYLSNVQAAADYLSSIQLGTGGWESYVASGENNEITAEALWGISTAYPELWVCTSGNCGHPGASFNTIQAAIDAATPDATINVYPGTYSESASGRFLYDATGPYQFGIFVGQAKGGITIQGVDAGGAPITNYADVLATVNTNATNGFGPSGFFIEGDNVTIAGIRVGANTGGQNKTLEVIGDNFTLKNSDIADLGGSLYINDFRFDAVTDTSHVKGYRIEGNNFQNDTTLDIASGAGYSGDVIGRVITGNKFTTDTDWTSISFSGADTGIPWFKYSVGGAVIQGNTFVNTGAAGQMIRARGTYDNTQFDWTSYWDDNIFSKAAITWATPIDVRIYSYPSSYGTFNNVRRIGATIQGEIANAQAGDTINVAAGAYTEQVTITKSLHLIGAGTGLSIIAAPASLPIAANATSAIVLISGSGVNAELTGFTVAGPGPSACESIRAGIYVYDGANANIHHNTVQDVRDSVFSGCQNGLAIAVGRNAWATTGTATIDHNTIIGYQKGGIVVDNTGSNAVITNNIVTGAGTTAVTAQNGIQISRGATATLFGNTVTGNSFHLDGNPWNWGAAGILLYQNGLVNLTGGNTVSGNDQNLYVDGAAVTVGADSFGPSTAPLYSGYEVTNYTGLALDLTRAAFPGELNNCQIEERILHGVDDTAYGLVTWDAGNLYVASPESKIQNAVDKATAGETVNVCAGTYDESVDIQKPLSVMGQGEGLTIIDRSANTAAGNVVNIHNLAGNVTFDGFTIKTGPASAVASNGIVVTGLTGPGTITISNNVIWAVQSATETLQDNFGLIAGYFTATTPNLVFDHNTVHGGGGNPILIEKWMGPTEITNNTLDNGIKDYGSSDVIFMMNYGGSHNDQKQLISGNTIDMGWGTIYDSTHRGAGISIAGSFTGGTTPGGFTNVEISNNNILNLKTARRGISLWNNSSDGTGGDIANVVISGNTISNALGYTGEFGIRVLGEATGTQITDNLLSGVNDAVKIQPWNGHAATVTDIHSNSLMAVLYGVNNVSTSAVDALHNWWGSAASPAAKVSANVTFSPWCANAACTTFAETEYTLTVTSAHGTVTKTPDQLTYHYGDVVTLGMTAVDAGWTFTGWTPALVGDTVTINGDTTVTANFTQNEYALTVLKVGNGTVTPNIAAPYHLNNVVVLTAVADAGWIFTGWTGACTGPGTCSVTMDAAKSVTANFTQPPMVVSINRTYASPTSASTLFYTVTFSQAVTGVYKPSFTLTTTGTISGASVSSVSGSGTTYTVLVNSGTGYGTIRLNLIDTDVIKNALNIPLGGTGAGNGDFTTGQEYTKLLPTVLSINRTYGNPTSLSTLFYTVKFSEAVTGVYKPSFMLTTTGTISGASVSSVSGSGATYTVLVNSGTGDGTIRLDLIDTDAIKNAGNTPLGGPGAGNGDFTTGQAYTVIKTLTTVLSINRTYASPTAASTLYYTVTFSEAVTSVYKPSFAVTTTGTISGAYVSSVSGSGATYTVLVYSGTGSGTIRLDLIDTDTIKNAVNSLPLGGTGAGNGNFNTGQAYTINRTPPTVVSINRTYGNPTSASTLYYTVTFSEAVMGVYKPSFALTTTGTISGTSVSSVSGSGTTYTVMVNSGTGSGTIRLDLIDTDSIKNALYIPLGGAGAGNGSFNTGQEYTVVR